MCRTRRIDHGGTWVTTSISTRSRVPGSPVGELPGRILRTRGDRPSVRPEWTSVLDVGDSAGFYVSGHLTGVMLAGSGW